MIKNPEKVYEGHAKNKGNETANLEIIYAMSLNKAYLGHHLEESESHHFLGHLDHLIEADGDRVGVVVDTGQEGGGKGHVCAWLLILRRIRRVPVVKRSENHVTKK